MTSRTIQQLNDINKNFYRVVGKDFDTTRQQPWEGWKKVVETIESTFMDKTAIKVLDVGCGNGRFGEYLHQQFSNITIQYTGIDADHFLLNQATQKNIPNATFQHIDIIEEDLSGHLTEKYDVVVLFGVLHHIPSFEQRQKILLQLTKVLKNNGLLIFTCWQFDLHHNLMERTQELLSSISINQNDLEPNDYLLDWKRGESAIRYCHLTTDSEISRLTADLELQTLQQLTADGKNNTSNIYVILQS